MDRLIRFIFPLGLILLSLLLSNCRPSHYYYPSSRPVKTPTPKPKEHPTQRPYVIKNKKYYPIPSAYGYRETGTASWYGKDFHGKKTSNGERYDMYAGTAAHKTLPMGTVLLVQNMANGRETVVRVNDRGPFVKNRIIDLSYAAAHQLNMDKQGTAKVRLVALAENEITKPPAQPVKGNYYIQVGAFADIQNARQLARKFANEGNKAYVRHNPNRRNILYRVLINGGHSLQQARSILPNLTRSGFPNSFIVTGSN